MEEQTVETKAKSKKKTETGAEKDAKIKALTEEVADYKDRWMRTQADFDNFRKRNADATTKSRELGAGGVYESVLQVLDNLERAIASMADEADKKGVEMIYNQFKDVLSKLGVEEVGAEGDEFNPVYHNAVSQIEDESLGENVIAQVYQKGYKIGEKVVRCAMVVVANP